MSRIKNINLAQARIKAKELKKSLSLNPVEAEGRIGVLSSFKTTTLDSLINSKPTLTTCQNIIANELGFRDWQSLYARFCWQELTREDFERAIAKESRLTTNGFGTVNSWKFTAMREKAEIKELREDLYNMFDGFVLACRWLSYQKRIEYISKERSSYSLKHIVERWAEMNSIRPKEVANGAFIAAAIHLKFNYRLVSESSLNVYLNISKNLITPSI